MIEERFSPKSVNFQALDTELRSSLGAAYKALMVSDSMIRVFLNESVVRSTVQRILEAHDPAKLTAEQQAEAAATAALATARAEHSAQLDLTAFAGEAAAVQQLAAHLAWLELEIRSLRGL